MAYSPETQKIDKAATDGLLGTSNSLAYRVHEIEKHFHSPECWLGAAAVPNAPAHVADTDGMTPFTLTAGNDDWGAWVQVAGSTDTPCRAGMVKLDLHRIMISDVSALTDGNIVRLQLGGGESGAAALASGEYTDVMFTPVKGGKQNPIDIQGGRFDAGTIGWARIWVDGVNAGTVDMFIGIHEYAG